MTPEENEKHNRRVNRLLKGVNNSEMTDEYAGLTEVNSLEQASNGPHCNKNSGDDTASKSSNFLENRIINGMDMFIFFK